MKYDAGKFEARLALGQIGFDCWPAIAVDALETGLDGSQIRRMVALCNAVPSEIDELLDAFLLECHLAQIAKPEAFLRLAFSLATRIRDESLDPLLYLSKLEWWFMQADYPTEFEALGFLKKTLSLLTNRQNYRTNKGLDQ